MPSVEDAIESLQKRLEQAKARKRQQEAAKYVAQFKADRKADSRRKLLVGDMYLDVAQQDLAFQAKHQTHLGACLKRPTDRGLFGLAEKGWSMPPDNEWPISHPRNLPAADYDPSVKIMRSTPDRDNGSLVPGSFNTRLRVASLVWRKEWPACPCGRQ